MNAGTGMRGGPRLGRGAAALAIALAANALLVLLLGWLNRASAPTRPEPPEVELSVVSAPRGEERETPEEPPEEPPSPEPRPRPPLAPPPPQAVPDLVLEPLPEVREPAPPEPPPEAEPRARETRSGPRAAESVDRPPVERALRSPDYPRDARRRGLEGHVRVRLLIDRRGRVERVEVLEVAGPESFADAVRRVAPEWRFEPARHDGGPVAVSATKTIRFALDGR